MITTTKTGGIMYLVLIAKRPITDTSGNNFLCLVLSIRGVNSISKPGIRVNTDNRLKKIDLISTMDISKPIPNSMNPNAAKPLMVVIEEDEISS